MIRFAALVIAGALEPASVAAYEALVARADATAARALLSGQRPRPIASADTLLDWVIEATNTPPFLVDACLQVTADKAEIAALLLSAAEGDPPTLTECLLALQANSPSIYLATAARLPPEARLIFNRLATGRFRTRLTAPVPSSMNPGTCHAILTMIDPAGPEGTFALPHGNGLAPLVKLRLTLPETPEILNWTRTHTIARFGAQRQVSPDLVFQITYQGTAPNPRRKCGFALVEPSLIAWAPHLSPDQATPLRALASPEFPLGF